MGFLLAWGICLAGVFVAWLIGTNTCAFGVCVGGSYAIGGDTSVEVGLGFGGITRAANISAGAGTSVSVPAGTLPGMQPRR
jgi:filamentous hemagglutinin